MTRWAAQTIVIQRVIQKVKWQLDLFYLTSFVSTQACFSDVHIDFLTKDQVYFDSKQVIWCQENENDTLCNANRKQINGEALVKPQKKLA